MWLISNNQAIPEVQHLGYDPDNVIISPDSRFVASKQSPTNDINIWSAYDGQLVHVLEGRLGGVGKANHLPVFSPDSQLLACNNGFFEIEIWCVVTGKLVCSVECGARTRNFVNGLVERSKMSNCRHLQW